ncbi:hypothetical protein MtrunA17_Chr4g0002691 [Medicago truncatula]|uniref:Uncharacterized protein n=1 Tax=Medicago truncatula TaxID=3880 RepID=G7JFM7_MEDTR|nr:hypothetical protein MTR_4g009010 [Medicago truncatula]RHN58460.1 hypothetical protein MtrunA17_Chr4g0002691 [Medicago truncatula]
MTAPAVQLSDECWANVIEFLIDDDDNNSLKVLSLISKQLLSLTNCHKFSLSISNQTLPYLPRLFQRFPNIACLNLTRFRGNLNHLNRLLLLISTFRLHLKLLNLSNQSTFPAKGLRALSKEIKITMFTPLTCSNFDHSLHKNDLVVSHDYNDFPPLKRLTYNTP